MLDLSQMGKWLIISIGAFLIIFGLIFWLGVKMGLPLGKLPGDLYIQKNRFSIHFPIITSIIVSIALTVIINLIYWVFRK